MAGHEERTESATAKRRNEVRRKGRVVKSVELSSTFGLLGLIFLLHLTGGWIGRNVTNYFQSVYAGLDQAELTPELVVRIGTAALLVLGKAISPLLLTGLILGFLIHYLQFGFLWATESIRLDLNRLNPLNGFSRFFSRSSLIELVKSSYKLTLISYIVYITLRGRLMQIFLLARLPIDQALALIGGTVYTVAIRVVLAMFVLAVLDYFYQRHAYEKSIRMTKEEVKQEFKQLELPPQIKSRIRARQREIARKRMMSEVPKADVVITNPTHFAVALKYDPTQMSAPLVVAKGQDLLAQRIREIAREHDVPIVENPPLARALYRQVEIGREIPTELYGAIAEVLAFVYQINARRRQRAGVS